MTPATDIHQGRNVKRLRELLNMKQEALAQELGPDWNQKKISLLEGREIIDDELLQQVAKALRVPVDAIKNLSEEKAVNIISNTFQDESAAYVENYKCTFNPIDKLMEALEENKKLYVQMLKEKDERIAILEKVNLLLKLDRK